jgi:hypothetical protein
MNIKQISKLARRDAMHRVSSTSGGATWGGYNSINSEIVEVVLFCYSCCFTGILEKNLPKTGYNGKKSLNWLQ